MLTILNIQHGGVILAAITSLILGGIWYGPLFGKTWAQLAGVSPKKMETMKKGASRSMAIEFILSLVTAYVLTYFMKASMATNSLEGMQIGALIWLGFFQPLTLGGALWEGKPLKLVMIHSGFRLVQAMAMGAVIGWWG